MYNTFIIEIIIIIMMLLFSNVKNNKQINKFTFSSDLNLHDTFRNQTEPPSFFARMAPATMRNK